jgi:hypothetical protein
MNLITAVQFLRESMLTGTLPIGVLSEFHQKLIETFPTGQLAARPYV